MTFTETANAMRRLADGIDKAVKQTGRDPETGKPKPAFPDDQAVGAAGMLCFIRDLVQVSRHEHFDKATLLVMLETVSRDPELFPCGLGIVMWQAESED